MIIIQVPPTTQDAFRVQAPGSAQDFSGLECGVCNVNFTKNCTVINCHCCHLPIHINCGVDIDEDIVCPLCLRGQNLIETRKDCFERQKIAAAKMTNFSAQLFPPLNIGDCVSLAVAKFDRGPLDFPNIIGVITATENGVYQVGTKDGIIKGWHQRTDMEIAQSSAITANDVDKNNLLSLREAAAKQSLSGGQGYKKCSCKPSKNQCMTKRCVCRKADHKCNSRCHPKSTCANK